MSPRSRTVWSRRCRRKAWFVAPIPQKIFVTRSSNSEGRHKRCNRTCQSPYRNGTNSASRERRPLLRRPAVPFPDYPVAPGDRNAVCRQPAGLAEAGHAVGADGFSPEQSAIFVHAIDLTAFDSDAWVGVGEAATVGADIIACEPREGLRRCGRDESDAQSQRQAQPANADG